MKKAISLALVAALFLGGNGWAQTPSTVPVVVDNRAGQPTFHQISNLPDFWTHNPVPLSALPAIPWSKTTGTEAALGNPNVSGYLLSSTASGIRSWVAVAPQQPFLWNGTSSATYLLNGIQESWNGAQARVTVQGTNFEHAFLAHTTGNSGMAIVGWSSTGAQAVKAIQDTYFTSPAANIYRSGNTASSDAPAEEITARAGTADLLKLNGANNSSGKYDANAAWHPPHLADTTAQPDSFYFSTTSNKLAFKDSSGIVHPLY